MQALDGAGYAHSAVARHAEQGGGFQDQERAQALAARLNRIAHRFLDPAVKPVRTRQDGVQGAVDVRRRRAHRLGEAQTGAPAAAAAAAAIEGCDRISGAMQSR